MHHGIDSSLPDLLYCPYNSAAGKKIHSLYKISGICFNDSFKGGGYIPTANCIGRKGPFSTVCARTQICQQSGLWTAQSCARKAYAFTKMQRWMWLHSQFHQRDIFETVTPAWSVQYKGIAQIYHDILINFIIHSFNTESVSLR